MDQDELVRKVRLEGATKDYTGKARSIISDTMNITGNLSVNGITTSKVVKKYRFHVLVTSWLPISEHYQSCAFTQKAIKFSKMMLSLGHEVFLYGVKSKQFDIPPCTEFIETHTVEDIRKVFGEGNNFFEIGYDWQKNYNFKIDEDNTPVEVRNKFFDSVVREVPKRYREGDFLCLTFGQYYQEIVAKLNIPLVVEYGIGYPNVFANYRAYESSYIQNYTYGKDKVVNLRPYDRVIPNYFDGDYFPFVDRDKKRDYILYIGRLIPRKGLNIAIKLAEATKTQLIMAGQGEMIGQSEYVSITGWADITKRAALMAYARAVVVPTVYLEPFGGVAAEAQLCGTPVITSNSGAFPETVIQGVTGFRCDTFQDYVDALTDVDNNVDKLEPKAIRKHAERYLMDNVKWEYQRWFDDIYEAYERNKAGTFDPFFFETK